MLKKLWLDEGGVILSTELILIVIILVIGLVTGLTALKTAVITKLADLAGAIAAIDTSYGFTGSTYDAGGTVGSGAYTNGSEYVGAPSYGSNTSNNIGLNALSVAVPLNVSDTITTQQAPQ